jgi:hypothetical protein
MLFSAALAVRRLHRRALLLMVLKFVVRDPLQGAGVQSATVLDYAKSATASKIASDVIMHSSS